MHSVEPPLLRRSRSAQLRLGLRNIYIVPTRFGLFWLAGVALLQLVAIQTRSNGTLLLGFLLLGLMLLAMHLTHDNLNGLHLVCDQPAPGFASQSVLPPALAKSGGPSASAVAAEGRCTLVLESLAVGETSINLLVVPQRRGLQRPGQLHVETIAPLGLFVCWSRWEPSCEQLIIPARRPGPVADRQPRCFQDGMEDWQDLKPYRAGERLALWIGPASPRGDLCNPSSFPIPSSISTSCDRHRDLPSRLRWSTWLTASGVCISAAKPTAWSCPVVACHRSGVCGTVMPASRPWRWHETRFGLAHWLSARLAVFRAGSGLVAQLANAWPGAGLKPEAVGSSPTSRSPPGGPASTSGCGIAGGSDAWAAGQSVFSCSPLCSLWRLCWPRSWGCLAMETVAVAQRPVADGGSLPLAAVLFLFLPRIGPLWITDVGSGQVATTGLSPELDPLGIAELVRRDAPAARVSFSGALPVEPYWRVLVHDRFDGRRWLRSAVAQPATIHASRGERHHPMVEPRACPQPIGALGWGFAASVCGSTDPARW